MASGSGGAGPPPLRRVLTLRTIISNSAGLTFATTSFVAAAQVASTMAGDAAWIAVLVAGVLAMLVAQSFAELNGMMPSAAAIRAYLQRAYGDDLAVAVSGLYMFVIILVLGAEAFVLAQALHFELPAVPPLLWIALLLVAALAVNWRGIEIAGRFQDAITYLVVASLFVFGYLAFAHAHFALPHVLQPGGVGSVAQAAAVGVFLFVGFEWVTPLAEEVTDNTLIAKGMMGAVALLTVAFMVITTAMGHYLDAHALGGTAPQMLFAVRVLGAAGGVWMIGICLGASATTFNAGLTAASRFLYATAREGSAPPWLARVHPRYLTPQNALLGLFVVVAVATVAVSLSRGFTAIVDMAAALEGVVYALVSVAVIRLRRREPAAARPYRAWAVPYLQWVTTVVFGALAVLSAVQGGWGAGVLLLVGFGAAWWYTRSVVPRLREAARQRRAAARGARRPWPAPPPAPPGT